MDRKKAVVISSVVVWIIIACLYLADFHKTAVVLFAWSTLDLWCIVKHKPLEIPSLLQVAMRARSGESEMLGNAIVHRVNHNPSFASVHRLDRAVYEQLFNSFGISLPIPDAVVIVDDRFYKMSRDARIGVIAHEAGHTYHQHKATRFTPIARILNVLIGRVQKKELEADKHGASQVGKERMIVALTELQSFIGGWIEKREVTLRIRALENLQ